MPSTEHENYAKDLLLSLSGDDSQIGSLDFIPNPMQSRNAAKAMEVILCRRLLEKSKQQPTHKANTTYEWKQGIFNCRNITDRKYLWTNMRRNVAEKIHGSARIKPAAYLLACSNPSDTMLYVWAIPEPLVHDSLSRLPPKEVGQEYTIEISPDKQRIEHDATSPDLTPFFQPLTLSRQELLALTQSREVDERVKQEKKEKKIARRLTEVGHFDPQGMTDARERILSSIVRRRGQPAFRKQLLKAYHGRCAITGCDVEAVLDAAHIIPYKGPKTNHPGNGLLLRTDLHTLFDLKLIAVDTASMVLLVSSSLGGTCYDGYRGRAISLPDDLGSQPNREALDQHRTQSSL